MRTRRPNWDEDDFEVGEVIERIETVSGWRRPDGQPSLLPTLPFSVHEFCPPDSLQDMEVDDVEFHEATGNEGASFERTYSRGFSHLAASAIFGDY